MADLEGFHIGWALDAIKGERIHQDYLVRFNDPIPENYGTFVNRWTCETRFQEELWPGTTEITDALFILEAQHRIYTFLVRFCCLILHDHTFDRLMSAEHQPCSNETLQSFMPYAYSHLEVMRMDSYCGPRTIDLDVLKQGIRAEFSAALDDISSMRGDPGFFKSVIDTEARCGDRSASSNNAQKSSMPASVPSSHLKNAIIHRYQKLELWRALYLRIQNLKEKQADYLAKGKAMVSLQSDLMGDYMELHFALNMAADLLIDDLKRSAALNSSMRKCLSPIVTEGNIDGITHHYQLKDEKELPFLYWMLFDQRTRSTVKLPYIIDQLSRNLESDKRSQNLITPWERDRLNSLAVIAINMHYIDVYHPYSFVFHKLMDSKNFHNAMLPVWKRGNVYKMGQISKKLSFENIQMPTNKELYYPASKHKTKEIVSTMRSAEERLAKVWEAIDQELLSEEFVMPGIKALLVERVVRRTPEWVELQQIGIKPCKKTVASSLLWEPSKETPEQKPGCYISDPKAPKIKTKGIPNTSSESNVKGITQSIGATTLTDNIQVVYKVGSKTFRVIQALFPFTSLKAAPTELGLKDFLKAMQDLKFGCRSLLGSAWEFTPPVGPRIVFHEPHSTTSLPLVMARDIGRRLGYAYGWHGGMFEEK